MKRLLLLILLGLLAGCVLKKPDSENPKTTGNVFYSKGGLYIYKTTIEGHDYLSIFSGGIIHSESCPCKKENTP